MWRLVNEKPDSRNTEGTVKYCGGSLMVWACIAHAGVGKIHLSEGNLNAHQYIEILHENIVSSIEQVGLDRGEILFQQDNDSKHTSKLVKEWLASHSYVVLKWSPQSTDLIENIWGHLKRRLPAYKKDPEGIIQLWGRAKVVWDVLPCAMCESTVSSMPCRMRAVIVAKGGHTKY